MISQKETDKYLAEVLNLLREIFEAGGKWALLDAIYYCCLLKRPSLPEWLQHAFLEAHDAKTAYQIKTWNDSFGQPHPKGTHVDKEKRHFESRHAIVQRVEELQSEMPVDKELFEKIGKDLGIGGGTTVSKIYYEERRRLDGLLNQFNEIRDQVLRTSKKK
jgi:hypothetical protein